MRLHELTMRAVGPFADEQVIDFDRLGAGGLFLFEGPTGVGKSTILDALTFALYGGLASDSGDAARMRSDFAAPTDRPEVRLEFSVRGGRYRITRSPEFDRPKKRGEGTTREKSAVHLERWQAGAWASWSHAKDEVGALVGEVLGLNRDQFRQVVLLPQGEFATFLRADDDGRREVLAKLFGTGFYRRITDQLQARAQEASRVLAGADSALAARVAAACEAAGMDSGEHALLAQMGLDERVAHLEQVGAALSAEAESARGAAEQAAASHEAALLAQRGAQAVVEAMGRRAAALESLALAEAGRPEQQERRERAAAARRVQPVRPLVRLMVEAAATLARRRQELAGLLGASGEARPGPQTLDQPEAATFAAQARALRSSADEAAHVLVVEQALAAESAQLAQSVRAADVLEASLGADQERAAHLPEQLAGCRARIEAARADVLAGARVSQMRGVVLRQSEAAAALVSLAASLASAREARLAARRAHSRASDHHHLLEQARWSDLRGALAARLVSGDPCLVCGSPEHPAPADSSIGGVSEEQVRQAAADRDSAQHVLDEAERAVSRAEAAIEVNQALAEGRTAQECVQELAEIDDQIAAGDRAAGLLPAWEREAEALADEEQATAASVLALSTQLATARAQAEAQRAHWQERADLVAEAAGGFASVAARLADLAARADALEACAVAAQAVEAALAQWEQAHQTALAEARVAGFPGLEQAQEAILSPEQLAALDAELARFDADVAAAEAALAEPALSAVAELDPDEATAVLQAAAVAAAEAAARLESASEVLTLAQRQAQRFADRVREVRAARDERGERAGVVEELVALDQYARGMAGSPRMSLVTYVLRYWFEQVVAAANVRLDAMSSGKYELIRLDAGSRRDARVGLGLAVLDRHTGRERSPGTLSGGESFYTSLALALGLADVVVAQAGGAQLDTLFIDEGFGSLDPDTLDDVMAVIDDLRGNGRVIGIVSHVPELKERIAERLSVRRVRADGPSLVQVRA